MNDQTKALALTLTIRTLKIPFNTLTVAQIDFLTDAGFKIKALPSGLTSISGKCGTMGAGDAKGFLYAEYRNPANKEPFDGTPVNGVYIDGKPLQLGQLLREARVVSRVVTCK